jgi:hypothetical protein
VSHFSGNFCSNCGPKFENAVLESGGRIGKNHVQACHVLPRKFVVIIIDCIHQLLEKKRKNEELSRDEEDEGEEAIFISLKKSAFHKKEKED